MVERFEKIGRWRVDLEGIQTLAHRHDPVKCGRVGCCCECYEISIGRGELERIAGMMPAASVYQPALREGRGYVNPVEEDPEEGFIIDADDNQRCIFAYETKGGALLCSIHSGALDLGLEPYGVKPRSCALWPLALAPGRPACLGVQPDALEFPCNRRRRARPDGRLDRGIAELIEKVFGAPYLVRVQQACAAYNTARRAAGC